jgi:tetratricopeptide (TPR) repeat protein
MRHHLFAGIAVLLGGCTLADDAATQERSRLCADMETPAQDVIAACTALIDKPGSSVETLLYAHFNRGVARRRSNDAAGALADIGRVVELDPDHRDELTVSGTMHAATADMDAAQRDFELAVEHNPANFIALTNLGSVHEQSNRPERALPYYDRAIALNPEWPVAIGGRCWVLAVLDRELEKALADCDRALTFHKTNYNAYNSRGFVNFRLGRFTAAVADYDLAIVGDPNTASSFYMRGLAKRALGRTAEGDADITRGIQLEPGVAQRYAGFGVKPH